MGWCLSGIHLVYGVELDWYDEVEQEARLEADYPDLRVVTLCNPSRDTDYWYYLTARFPEPTERKAPMRMEWDLPDRVMASLSALPPTERFHVAMRALGQKEETIAKAQPKLLLGVNYD